GRLVRGPLLACDRRRRGRTPARRVHERRDSGYDRGRTSTARRGARGRRSSTRGGLAMKAVKVLFISIGALLAAMIVIPLTILAGLFVWLKLTEEADEEDLEIEDTI